MGGDEIECQSHQRGVSEIINEKGKKKEGMTRGEEDEWREGNGTMRDERGGMRDSGRKRN